MPFEQILRDHLLDDAEVVSLPERVDPARPIARAKARRRHRVTAAAVATVAVVAVAGVAAVPALRDDGDGTDTVITPAAEGLVPTGPLDLAWSSAEDGLSGVESQFQQADGTVYALSTGPGVRYGDDVPFPKGLYRLDENGVWQLQELDSEHRMQDVAGVGDALYGVSTGPASQGDGSVVRLSRSGDGGETWTDEDIPPAEAPSADDHWSRSVTMKVESNGPVTLAVVNTQFSPDVTKLFPELAEDNGTPNWYNVEARDEGLVLMQLTSSGSGASADGLTFVPEEQQTAPTSTVAPEQPTEQPTTTDVDILTSDGRPVVEEDVHTIPWSDLGVSSQAGAYPVHNQVFRLDGDTWQQVDNDLGASVVYGVGVAGDLFTATGFRPVPDGSEPVADETTYVSADGAIWTPVETPHDGRVVGAGPGLVNAPYEGTTLDISADGGASWSQLDLAAVGMAGDCTFAAAAGGPLGVALVIAGPDGSPEALATSADLVTWTITTLSEIAGTDDIAVVTPFVGRDRVVLLIQGHKPGGPESVEPGPSRTAVGTPRRS
jgi:hypothetical protein